MFFWSQKIFLFCFAPGFTVPSLGFSNRKHLLNPINSGRMFYSQSRWGSFIPDRVKWEEGECWGQRKRESKEGRRKGRSERATKKAVISRLGNTEGHNKTSPLFN